MYKLLTYHMQDVNPEYRFGHAIVAGKLASKEIKTLEEYRDECRSYGIACYPGAWEQWAKDVNLTVDVLAQEV